MRNSIYNIAAFVLLPVALIISLGGCGGKQINPKTGKAYSEEEFRIYEERLKFEASHETIAAMRVEQNSKVVGTMLLEPAQKVMYVVSLPAVKRVLSLHIDDHDSEIARTKQLVPEFDYFWDSNNNELLLPLSIPHVYLLDNEYSMVLELNVVNHQGRVQRAFREFRFWHKPMAENDEAYKSYRYVNSYTAENVDGTMKQKLREEINDVDTDRVSWQFKQRLDAIE